MKRERTQIDRDKLRNAIRNLGNEYIVGMLSEAIDLLPPPKLYKLAKDYLDLERLRPEAESATGSGLIADVKRFEKASLAGEYYQSFEVNWRNSTQQSTGTSAWFADCRRLLHRCVRGARKGDPAEVRQAFDVLFGLLDHIDECLDDVIFIADEGGSWQVGVHWARVLPAWFRVLSATAPVEEYAERIQELLSRHHDYGRDKMLVIARRKATPAQRAALAKAETARTRRSRT